MIIANASHLINTLIITHYTTKTKCMYTHTKSAALICTYFSHLQQTILLNFSGYNRQIPVSRVRRAFKQIYIIILANLIITHMQVSILV